MVSILSHLDVIAAALGVVALVVAVVVALNVHGRRLERHQELIRRLQLSVDNVHRDRRAKEVKLLQLHALDGRPSTLPSSAPSLRPPPLSEARTMEVTRDELDALRTTMQPQPPDPKDPSS